MPLFAKNLIVKNKKSDVANTVIETPKPIPAPIIQPPPVVNNNPIATQRVVFANNTPKKVGNNTHGVITIGGKQKIFSKHSQYLLDMITVEDTNHNK